MGVEGRGRANPGKFEAGSRDHATRAHAGAMKTRLAPHGRQPRTTHRLRVAVQRTRTIRALRLTPFDSSEAK